MPRRFADPNPVKIYDADRRCVNCDALLSRYNPENTCYSCQEDVPLVRRSTSARKLTGRNTW